MQKLDREQLAKFHDANYAPNQSLLAFAGDITPEEAFAAAEKYFGAWPKVANAAARAPRRRTASGQHIWLIDKPDAVQTQIRVGKLGIRRGDPNYIPVVVMNRIFGGGYNSRLNTEVRVKKGLTYGANSAFSPHRYAGAFSVETYTRTAATVEATKLVVDLVAKMSTGRRDAARNGFRAGLSCGRLSDSIGDGGAGGGRILTVAAFDLPADLQQHVSGPHPQLSQPSKCETMAQKYFPRTTSISCLPETSAHFATR